MIRNIISLTLFSFFLAATTSAQGQSSNVRDLDPCYFTSPPITILRPDSANLADSIENAEIRYRCQLDGRGRVIDATLLYSSTANKMLLRRARKTLMATAFDPKWPGRMACDTSLLHVMFLRKEIPTPFHWTYFQPKRGKAKELQYTPEMYSERHPTYTKHERAAGIEGTVTLSVLVDTAGLPHEASVAKTSGNPMLDNAALMAAYCCRYKPAIKDRRPIFCRVKYTCEFKIRD